MTELTEDQLQELKAKALESLQQVHQGHELEAWRIAYIGRKGQLPQALRQIKEISAAKRGPIGKIGNQIKEELENAFEDKQHILLSTSSTTTVSTATTSSAAATTLLPAIPKSGHLHPLTVTMRKVQKTFLELGFDLYEGPDVEEAKYNFDNLNISFDHPARAATDTFYIDSSETTLVLRTHVSPLQTRAVIEHNLRPPFKYFYYGKSYRNEKTDATHENTFNQFEFIGVHENANVSEVKGIIEKVYSDFFGGKVATRFRPGYFPFVEPGFEIDMSCVFCRQKGCTICKNTGWIEMAGAGIVHPNVLKNMNIDSSKYQGYALGAAIDRLAMLYYGIDDIRLFWSGNLQFLNQF